MCVGMTTQSSSSVIRGKVVFGSKLLQLPFLHGLLATCLFGGPWAMVLRKYTTWYLSFGGVPRGSDPAPSTQLWSTDSHSASTSEMQGST